jgi:hypothetical protein
MPLDDHQKRKLRNTARVLHWMTLLVLGLALVAGLLIRTAEPKLVRVYFEKSLLRASGAVVSAFGDFNRDRRDGLTSFLPPARPDAMILWAKTVQDYLGQPAAVFVREGSHTTWINSPEEFQEAVSKVPALFNGDSSSAALGSMDTLGAFERRRARVEVNGVGHTVWVVGPLADSLRWGALVRFEDIWRPFFKMLEEGASAPQLQPASQQLNVVLQVENAAPEPTSRTGMRAFLHDELLYQTPGLDTTHHVYPVKLSGYAKMEYFLSDEDQRAMDYFLAQGLSWGKLLLTALVGVAVHVFWRWIMKLTAD